MMTTPNPMIASLQRLSGRELLINTETTDEFVANVVRYGTTTREEAAAHEVTSRENLCMVYGIDDPDTDAPERKPFVYQDGIGVIPVHGSLINRFNGSWGFVTGYNFIRRQMNLMLDDDDVDAIIFDVNSPGGEASGCFELAREIMAARRVKPSLAMVDSLAASGGIALAGAATRMYGIPSARIGSIGVYRQHISVEGALKDAGVKITYATAGAHKIDGTPFKDLPDSVLREWTEDVNKTWDDFIDLVAEARGMEPSAVRDTQARVYRADEALALGLINAVKTTADAVPEFVAEMAQDEPFDEEDSDMTTKNGSEATSGVDYEKIGGLITTGISSAMTTMFAAQNRATAIRDHGKAKGQVALAAKLTANDKISEAEAIEMIDAAAAAAKPGKAQAKAKGNRQRVEEPEDNLDDEDDDLDDEGDEGDDLGEDDEDGEDEAEQARAARRGSKAKGGRGRDNVNHLDVAMKGKSPKVGGGEGESEKLTGDAAATASLLSDYRATTGSTLGQKKSAA